MKIISYILFCAFFIFAPAYSQSCGPMCPVCSGSGGAENSGGLIESGSLQSSFLYIPDGEEEKSVFNFRTGLTSWLDVGIGYAFEEEELLWSARISLLKEKSESIIPGIIIGAGSVTSRGSDQSVFALVSKSFNLSPAYRLNVNAGLAKTSSDLQGVDDNFSIYGASMTIRDKYTPFINYDGISYHYGLSYTVNKQCSLSLMMIESEEFALSLSYKFDFR